MRFMTCLIIHRPQLITIPALKLQYRDKAVHVEANQKGEERRGEEK